MLSLFVFVCSFWLRGCLFFLRCRFIRVCLLCLFGFVVRVLCVFCFMGYFIRVVFVVCLACDCFVVGVVGCVIVACSICWYTLRCSCVLIFVLVVGVLLLVVRCLFYGSFYS